MRLLGKLMGWIIGEEFSNVGAILVIILIVKLAFFGLVLAALIKFLQA